MSISPRVKVFLLSTDQKDMMEVENRNMVLTFGSHLDQSLIDLHKTILGSVSEQRQHLRCMEEHVESFLASKTDVSKSIVLSLYYILHLTGLIWLIILHSS